MSDIYVVVEELQTGVVINFGSNASSDGDKSTVEDFTGGVLVPGTTGIVNIQFRVVTNASAIQQGTQVDTTTLFVTHKGINEYSITDKIKIFVESLNNSSTVLGFTASTVGNRGILLLENDHDTDLASSGLTINTTDDDFDTTVSDRVQPAAEHFYFDVEEIELNKKTGAIDFTPSGATTALALKSGERMIVKRNNSYDLDRDQQLFSYTKP